MGDEDRRALMKDLSIVKTRMIRPSGDSRFWLLWNTPANKSYRKYFAKVHQK